MSVTGKIFAVLIFLFLSACGGNSPFIAVQTEADEPTDNVEDVDTTAPITDQDSQFLFDADRNLTANLFIYDPLNNTIQINNLPFDNVDDQGGQYTQRVLLPDGTTAVYESPDGDGSFKYLAVIVDSPSGYAFGGAVATGNFGDFGHGGAYIERSDSGLPPERAASYIYRGEYRGTRVLGNGGLGIEDLQLIVGTAEIEVDLRDLDTGGSAIGAIIGRTVYDADGMLLGQLSSVSLDQSAIDVTTSTLTQSTSVNRNNDGTAAQSGNWNGLFAGPNGEEIIGYLVIEGRAQDNDLIINNTNINVREIGVFRTDLTNATP